MHPLPARLPAALTLLLAGALAACGDSNKPSPNDLYGWRIPLERSPGVVDSVTFHWERSDLPVQIWAEDRYDLPEHTQRAISRWRTVLGDDRFDARLVSDSSEADVIVRAIFVQTGPASHRLGSLMAQQCEGGTSFETVNEDRVLVTPILIYVVPRVDPDVVDITRCFDLTTTHEIGHAIGLFQHSANTFDVMYRDPDVAEPSARDRATVRELYETRSDLTPVRSE